MGDFGSGIITVLVAIVGVASLAVIFSRNSQSPQVASAFFGGIAQDIGAAVSPITGGQAFNGASLSFTPNF